MSITQTQLTRRHGLLAATLLLLHLLLPPPQTAAQSANTMPPPPPDVLTKVKFDKSMAVVLVILVIVFFALGFLSVYTRQCAERRMRARFDLTFPLGGSHRRQRGLDREIIETFPTFVYSAVKTQKIGRATLECAVCLNEFNDDETLRLIPKCSHVFHPDCIDAWLANHSTCPVCRANLFPIPSDNNNNDNDNDNGTFVAVQIPDPESNGSQRSEIAQINNGNDNRGGGTATAMVIESPKMDNSVNQRRTPLRSRSTGFRIGSLFPRSHSTGHSLVQPGESLERFTLRLPEEVRNRLLISSTPRRTMSPSGATFARESSVRRGFRTRSVGPGRSYVQYERFGRLLDRRGFNWTPPFFSRGNSSRSPVNVFTAEGNMEVAVETGERSSDRLFGGGES